MWERATIAQITKNQAERAQDSSFAIGLGLAIAGTFLFAMKSIWIKSAYSVGGDPTLILTLRMLLSAPFYVGMLIYLRLLARKRTRVAPRQVLTAIGIGFFGYYLASYLDLCGLELVSAQLERLTLFSYPTMIAVLAWVFLGESLTPRILLALGFCYLGIFVMYSQEVSWAGDANLTLGIALVLGSALSYSVYIILAKPLIQNIGSREFTSYAMLGSATFVMVHAGSTSAFNLQTVSPTLWGYGVLLAFVCTVLPSFMINEAIRRIGATHTTIIGSIGPVITMILAVVWLREPTSLQHFLGMLIVVAGVSLVSKK